MRNHNGAILSSNAIADDNVQFRTDREPVLTPGAECTAFTSRMRDAAGLRQTDEATPMEHGHGCWVAGENTVALLTTATPFAQFWRHSYPDDDGSGLTAMVVDKTAAQLDERLILHNRYYAVRVGGQWVAGLDSGVMKTACMLAVDTGSTHPLLINVTQQVSKKSVMIKTVRQQCTLASTIAETVLDEQDAGGGSR